MALEASIIFIKSDSPSSTGILLFNNFIHLPL
jgi:hypothetical protein